jgi:plastocyanin
LPPADEKAMGEKAMDAGMAEIHIDNFSFNPAELTIAKGTTVKWTNRDDIPHTVVEKGITFKSKTMDTDETFTHTFDTVGEVTYFCSLHPHMTGKIVVK